MPIYCYQHPETGETIDVVQGMNEKHEYTDSKGTKWNRVFTVPQAAISTKIDAHDPNAFVEKTGKMKGTYGDVLDYSAELSEKRAERYGEDPVKRKMFDNYEKINKAKHLADRPSKIENDFASVSIDSKDY